MNNHYFIKDDIVEISLNSKEKGRLVTLVDKKDLAVIRNNIHGSLVPYWDDHTKSFYCRGYILVNGKRKMIQLHRLLTNCPVGKQVDHINHDTLDNRQSNLRIVTHSENQFNRSGAQRNNHSSGVRGVTWHKRHKKWVASFQRNGKRRYLGYFETIDEAKNAISSAIGS